MGIKHDLVPLHEVLDKQQTENVLKELGVKVWQLPRISEDDPAIVGMKPEPGQLVRIVRRSELVGDYVVYRVVAPTTATKSSRAKKEEKHELKKEKPQKKSEKKKPKSRRASPSKGKKR